VVHVEEMGVAQALDVLGQGYRLLYVAVLLLVVAPDGVVDQDAVDSIVLVGGHDGLLETLLINLAEIEVKAAVWC